MSSDEVLLPSLTFKLQHILGKVAAEWLRCVWLAAMEERLISTIYTYPEI